MNVMHGLERVNKALPLASLLLLAGVGGCSWTDKHGTHHLIVGVGFAVVTTTNCAGVEVIDSRSLGLTAGPQGAGVGFIQHHRVAIDPVLTSNVVVSIKANPFDLTVKTFDPYSTQVTNTNQSRERKQPQ